MVGEVAVRTAQRPAYGLVFFGAVVTTPAVGGSGSVFPLGWTAGPSAGCAGGLRRVDLGRRRSCGTGSRFAARGLDLGGSRGAGKRNLGVAGDCDRARGSGTAARFTLAIRARKAFWSLRLSFMTLLLIRRTTARSTVEDTRRIRSARFSAKIGRQSGPKNV